jgi:flagellar biosynthesis protein FliQ
MMYLPLLSRALNLVAVSGALILGIALAGGIVAGVLRAATQIHDDTINIACRAGALALGVLVAGGYVASRVISFGVSVWSQSPYYQ